MKFITKLVVFAVGLTAIMGVYRITEFVRGDRHKDEVTVVKVDMSAPAEAPEPPEPPTPMEPAVAAVEIHVPQPAAVAAVGSALAPGEVRIVTQNGAGFLTLRHDNLVAGLSDSLLQSVRQEMQREMQGTDGGKIGAIIKDAVTSGVNKIMQQQVTIPVSEIRDIDYRRGKIVLRYKQSHKDALIDLESIHIDGDKPFLAGFSETDATRLVEAVRSKIR